MTEPQRPCPNCSNLVSATATFCPYCGTALPEIPSPSSEAPATPAAPRTPASFGGMQLARCEMIVGYLVPHRCDNPALGRCSKCGRGYCEEHVELRPDGLMCLACLQGLDQPVALPLTAQTYTPADIALFDTVDTWDNDDGDDMFADLS